MTTADHLLGDISCLPPLAERTAILVNRKGFVRKLTMLVREGEPWPAHQCSRLGTAPWDHQIHVGDGRYEFAGQCDDFDHGEMGAPEENARRFRLDECCCGRPGCDGTGPYPEPGS